LSIRTANLPRIYHRDLQNGNVGLLKENPIRFYTGRTLARCCGKTVTFTVRIAKRQAVMLWACL
jgi:hypothetical protein